MISFIVWSVYLYLVQLMIPNFIKSRIEYSTRANKAFKNLSESFSIFLALAILSIVLNVEAHTTSHVLVDSKSTVFNNLCFRARDKEQGC